MAAQVNNPYVAELRQKMLAYESAPTEELKNEIALLESKSRDFVRQQLNSFSSAVSEIAEKKENVLASKESISKQYKEMCDIYRQADFLMKQTRLAKQSIREEIAARRKAK